MVPSDRIIRVLEAAIQEIKEPKSDQDLYQSLRLLAAVANQEAKNVLSTITMNQDAGI